MNPEYEDLLVRQYQREIEQGDEAKQRLTIANRKAHERTYASSSVYGQKLLKEYVLVISAHLKTHLKRLGRGRGAVDAATIYNHLNKTNPDVIALITMKVALDVLGKNATPTFVELTKAIGQAIETELRVSWYRKQDPDIFRRIQQYFHPSTGLRQKNTVFRLVFNSEGIQWKTWGSPAQHKVGAWCLDALMTTTGWLSKDTVRTSIRKTHTVIRYSREFLAMREQIMAKALELAHCKWPMLCPPLDWSNEERGGYLSPAIRHSQPMIRRADFNKTLMQGSIPIAFLNRLQSVAYRINRDVLDVANTLYERQYSVGSFIRLGHIEPPPRCKEDADDETIKAYKRQRRIIEDHNAQLEQKNWRTTETLYVARLYAPEERWWLSWSYDYRGRTYSQCGFNPQGTDFDKSLFYFADEGEVNEEWLAWHVATTMGHDKLSHEARRAWTRENKALITAIATQPLNHVSEWEVASEPFCFLAACFEYHACCIAKTKTTSGLPVGLDATCSGIQHLSSMTLDRTAAEQVNVVKGKDDAPSDGYRTVAERAIHYIKDEEVHSYIDRKTTKRACMTLPYGCSRSSARSYIRQALKDKGLDLSKTGRLAEIVTAIYDKAIPEVFSGPCAVMNWLQATAKELMETNEAIRWKTPSGFIVVQDLRKSLATRIQTTLMGSVVACFVGDGWGDPDVKHHVGAIAPNLVHSLDSSLLHLCFAFYELPFTVIHDCVLGRSCDMEQIGNDIRMHHADISQGLPLEDWADQVGVIIPDGLMKNDLDIDEVLHSPYFFC